MMKTLFQEYKGALIFLAKYVGLYLVLNTLYAFFIEYYLPGPDPVTTLVTRQVAYVLNMFSGDVSAYVNESWSSIPLLKDNLTVVRVFEGCNSVNVMIVYVTFLIAFSGPSKKFWMFLAAGLISIYIINLLRVLLLYEVALHFPENLYFFHKFFFTGIIYLVVFIWWYFWVAEVKRWKIDYNRSNG